jgi:hypothetical protein
MDIIGLEGYRFWPEFLADGVQSATISKKAFDITKEDK